METERTDFVGDWVSKDIAIHHGMTTYKYNIEIDSVKVL
jgi:hypothetical protein